jgi:hypothetical protein
MDEKNPEILPLYYYYYYYYILVKHARALQREIKLQYIYEKTKQMACNRTVQIIRAQVQKQSPK